MPKPRPIVRASSYVIGYTILFLLIMVNWYLFKRFLKLDYFLWYLDKGPLIGLSVGLMSIYLSDKNPFADDLLSLNPTGYLVGITGILTLFYSSLAAHFSQKSPELVTFLEYFEYLLDAFLSFVFNIILMCLSILWAFVIAPINYIPTIISGAPARMELRGITGKVYLIEKENGYNVEIVHAGVKYESEEGSIDFSFGQKPFAITQTLTSILLWIINYFILQNAQVLDVISRISFFI